MVAWGCGFPTDSGQCSVQSGLVRRERDRRRDRSQPGLEGRRLRRRLGVRRRRQLGTVHAFRPGLSGVTAVAARPSSEPGPEERWHRRRLGLQRPLYLRAVQRAERSFRRDCDRCRLLPQPGLEGRWHGSRLGLRLRLRQRAVQRAERPLRRERDRRRRLSQPGVGRAHGPDNRLRPAREGRPTVIRTSPLARRRPRDCLSRSLRAGTAPSAERSSTSTAPVHAR